MIEKRESNIKLQVFHSNIQTNYAMFKFNLGTQTKVWGRSDGEKLPGKCTISTRIILKYIAHVDAQASGGYDNWRWNGKGTIVITVIFNNVVLCQTETWGG